MIRPPDDHDDRKPTAPGDGTGAGGETYAIEDSTPASPPLPGDTVAAHTVDELLDRVAADLVVHAENCVRRFGDFHLSLTGSRSLQRLYDRLMYDPNYRRLPWRRSHLWITAEPRLPLDDDRSTYKQIKETLVDHADIPLDQVHAISAESKDADLAYEEALREGLAWREKGHDRLDYVLLVLGRDGAVAGLAPGSTSDHERGRLVQVSRVDAATPPEVVTMTMEFINAARFVAVVATGSARADAVRRLAAGDEAIGRFPAAGLAPLNGELKWYVDEDACGQSRSACDAR